MKKTGHVFALNRTKLIERDKQYLMAGSAEKKVRREAYTLAFNKFYPLVFNIVYNKTGNKYDADDICQEIFLIFFEKFEEVQNHRKWLFGTIRNVLIRYYNRKTKTDVDVENLLDDIGFSYVNGFKDLRIMVNDAVENVDLNEEEKMLIDYIAYNRYSYNNVGKIMGLTKKQVIYRYSRAVRKIIGYLREKGIHNIEDLL